MKYFILANALLLSALTVFYWLPRGRELASALDALRLQEQRLAVKETDIFHLSDNLAESERLQSELAEIPLTLIPYSGMLTQLADLQTLAERLGVTETDFFMDEPVIYDTPSGQVSVMEGAAAYDGAYDGLIEMAMGWLDAGCQVEAMTVSKSGGSMTVSFYLCGIHDYEP